MGIVQAQIKAVNEGMGALKVRSSAQKGVFIDFTLILLLSSENC